MKNIVMDNVPFITLDISSSHNVEIPGNCTFSFTSDTAEERVLKISHQLFEKNNLLICIVIIEIHI